jgi:quinol monooxygenase YgiN
VFDIFNSSIVQLSINIGLEATMSVVRINNFIALPGKLPELIEAFQSIVLTIRNCQGCELCNLFVSAGDDNKIVIIEQWRDIAAHQAAAKLIDPDDFKKVMALLEEKPTGQYYTASESQS